MFEDESTESLRKKVTEYNAASAATADAPPLPDGAPAGLTEIQRENLFENWVGFIEEKAVSTWTPSEKAAIQFSVNRVLRGLR